MANIFPLARQKLIHGHTLEDRKLTDPALAVSSQCFGLDMTFGHPESVKFIDTAIISHMRFCNSIIDNQEWRLTSYPLEPFMSSAAATIMHEGTRNLIRCLEVLNEKLRNGIIERGERV